MSWDLTLLRMDGPFDPDDPPPPLPLGRAATVRSILGAWFPAIRWSGPSGLLDTAEWLVELDLWGRDGPAQAGEIDHVALRIRGNGLPWHALVALCKANGWAAFDDQDGCFLDLDAPEPRSWTRWRSYRDHVVGSGAGQPAAPGEIAIYRFEGPPRVTGTGFDHLPLGTESEVRRWIAEALPGVEWTGKRGTLRVGQTLVEVHLAKSGETVAALSLRVLGADWLPLVARLCEPRGWSAFDCAAGDFCYLPSR